MKLIAHGDADGRISSLVAIPKGGGDAGLVSPPGAIVCEIHDHGFRGGTGDLEELGKLLDTHLVQVTPARGKLVRRPK